MAKKPAPKPSPQAFKIEGEFVRFTFIREYKAKGNSEADAISHFTRCLESGAIIKVRMRGEVGIFEFKK